jgi:hypothetical protein
VNGKDQKGVNKMLRTLFTEYAILSAVLLTLYVIIEALVEINDIKENAKYKKRNN